MNVLTGQAIGGSEAANGGQDLVLKAFAAIEVAFLAGKLGEEIANESTHGCVSLRGFNASLSIDIIWQ
jgi:hypothetical protein